MKAAETEEKKVQATVRRSERKLKQAVEKAAADDIMLMFGTRLPGAGRGEMAAKSYVRVEYFPGMQVASPRELLTKHGKMSLQDLQVMSQQKPVRTTLADLQLTSPYPSQPTYVRIKFGQYKVKWKTERLSGAFSEATRRICIAIQKEFKDYVASGYAASGQLAHPAISRGTTDPNSLINSVQVVRTGDGWGLEVVNRVWLFQEYGFDMHGKLPPRYVALKILEWAIRKGIVYEFEEEVVDKGKIVGTRTTIDVMDQTDVIHYRRRAEKIKKEKIKALRAEYKGVFGRGKKKKREKLKEDIRDLQNRNYLKDIVKIGHKVRQDMVYQEGDIYEKLRDERERAFIQATGVTGDFKSTLDPKLEKLMWKLTRMVVKNSAGNNRRLFLTTAYRNVVEDKQRVRRIFSETLEEYGFGKRKG